MSFKRAAAENGFISFPSKNFRGSQPHLLCHKVILQVIRGNYTMSLYRTVQKYIFRLANFCPDAWKLGRPHLENTLFFLLFFFFSFFLVFAWLHNL